MLSTHLCCALMISRIPQTASSYKPNASESGGCVYHRTTNYLFHYLLICFPLFGIALVAPISKQLILLRRKIKTITNRGPTVCLQLLVYAAQAVWGNVMDIFPYFGTYNDVSFSLERSPDKLSVEPILINGWGTICSMEELFLYDKLLTLHYRI